MQTQDAEGAQAQPPDNIQHQSAEGSQEMERSAQQENHVDPVLLQPTSESQQVGFFFCAPVIQNRHVGRGLRIRASHVC